MEIYILLLLLLVLAAGMFVGSVLGFADALIFISLSALFFDVRISIVLIGFWSTGLSLMNSIKYRGFIDKPFFKKFILPGVIGVIIGSLLIVIAPIRWLELIIGLFIMCYIVIKIRELKKEKEIQRKTGLRKISGSWFYSGAFSYGFFGGLIGASGPFNVVLLERTGHERENFIANFALCSVSLSPIKLGIYIGAGLFPLNYILLFLLGLAVIFIVTKLGHQVTPRIPKDKFMMAVLFILLIIGIRMILSAIFFY